MLMMPRQAQTASSAIEVVTKLSAVVHDEQLDAAGLRRRVARLARQLVQLLEVRPEPAPYEYISVKGTDGATSSVSIRKEEFAQMEQALGGRRAVIALAKQIALTWEFKSGVSRSAFVRERLERRIKRGAGAAGKNAVRSRAAGPLAMGAAGRAASRRTSA